MAEATSFFTDGGAYERFLGRWSRLAGEEFIDWLSLPHGLNWLDVGCGTGAFTELVLERCAPGQISGVDPAGDQIAYAQGRTSVARAAFRVGDAQSLPYADTEFDAAVMALVISFVPDAAKAVREMRRVVRAGGTVAAYMWDYWGGGFVQRPLIQAIEAMNVSVGPSPLQRNSRMDELIELFEQSGLESVVGRPIEIEISYRDFDDYWDSQTALVNPAVQAIRKMPEADVARLKAHLQERLAADRNGRIAYPARANAVKGRVPG
jgi:ubiquinone/menaquinone biosynthesis C-methylase UbiE